MTAAPQLQQAYVLHRRPYRNTSLLLDVLSADHGRVGLVARGGQRNALLQPFQPLLLGWRGRHELRSLTGVEAAQMLPPLQGESLYCGLYLNELLVRLLHRDVPQLALFATYAETLNQLLERTSHADVILRRFEFQLLDELGYGFSLTRQGNGQLLTGTARYRFYTDAGLLADADGPYLGKYLLAMAAGDWQDNVRRQARDLMREALLPLLGDKPLLSRQLFRGAGKMHSGAQGGD